MQVLTPLQWPDLLWLAALPGISEELLFRGALIPAISPDWCARPPNYTFLPHRCLCSPGHDLSIPPARLVLWRSWSSKRSRLLCRQGVLLAGAVFGVLHNSGGRNLAFAAWATAVGTVYGAAYLQTGDIAVPAGAHVLANLAGAVIWRLNDEQP